MKYFPSVVFLITGNYFSSIKLLNVEGLVTNYLWKLFLKKLFQIIFWKIFKKISKKLSTFLFLSELSLPNVKISKEPDNFIKILISIAFY